MLGSIIQKISLGKKKKEEIHMVIDDKIHSMVAPYNISYNISVCTCVCVRARFLIIKKMIPSLFVH